MDKRKDILYTVLFLVVILTLCICLLIMIPSEEIAMMDGDGYYDLSAANFDGMVYQDAGYWEAWPEKLYTPEDLRSTVPPGVLLVSTPHQYATFRLRLKLPPGQTYGIYLTSADFSMRIFIDGVLTDSVGVPGTSREETVPRVLERVYFFTPQESETEIIIQAANFVHSYDGVMLPRMYLGASAGIIRFTNASNAMGFIITGFLLSAFLYHLGLFFLNRNRKTVLVFSAACLMLALMNKKLYFILFPEYDWFIAIRVEYIIHFLTFFTLVLFVDMLHPKTLNKYLTKVYFALTAVYLLTLMLDTRVFSGILIGFEIASMLMIVYIIIRLAIVLKSGSMKNWLSFAGVFLLGLLGMNDILYYRGVEIIKPISGQFFFTPIGMMFFVFCYALVLSIEYAETEHSMETAREAEQKLAAENAMLDSLSQMKSEYLANISHEMKTPLSVMSGYAQQTEEEIETGETNDKTVRNLRVIQAEAQRLAELAGNVLYSVKNLQTGIYIKPTKPEKILEHAAAVCAPIVSKNGNCLETFCEPDCPEAAVNLEMIVQVLVNLCANAGKHTKNGTVTISVKQADEFIEFTVCDDGNGIGPEFLLHVFERGVSGDDTTGLGLAICKDIINQHGGEIDIDSILGQGTTVTFSLPLSGKKRGGR